MYNFIMGIGDWGLGPIPNPQSPIPNAMYNPNYIYIGNIIYMIINTMLFIVSK